MAHTILERLVTHNGNIMSEGPENDYTFEWIAPGVHNAVPDFRFDLKPGDVVQVITISLPPSPRLRWVARQQGPHEPCVLVEEP